MPDELDRLTTLYQIAQTINSSLDLGEVLDMVMDRVIEVTGAERGFLMLMDEAGQLDFKTARRMDRADVEEPTFQVSRGIVEQVAQTGQALLATDAQFDERLSSRASILFLGVHSILCVPLRVKDRAIGLVYVDSRLHANSFDRDDLQMLETFASQAAIAIDNAQKYTELQTLYRTVREKERMEQELRLAHGIQARLLPQRIPQVPGWEFAAAWQPAREVGGDFYDFIPASDEHWGLFIADVADKGVPAALFMAMARGLLWASRATVHSPAQALAQTNRHLEANAAPGMFITACYAILDVTTGLVTYANAGHNHPLLAHANGTVSRLGVCDTALAVLADCGYQEQQVTLRPGEALVLYTDGVTDAVDAAGARFGLDRLTGAVAQAGGAAAVTRRIVQSVDEFSADATPFDDLTLVVVSRDAG
ncbi:MAG: SpoIIE family protein phosphatase [Chloroflexi bacterium]|nr:SpoIIE family protein phosphatase [Chloroflexota bacterium]MBU1752048.1 SpoIIE family protein phosphatase [Chloroflexota bacterium]MBU1879444.1 SpoIIE family protein phosphatase [Chloroflexota bacterium]